MRISYGVKKMRKHLLPRPAQGVRERARVPQLVMLCRRWAHLQCFAGRTGRTHGTTAGYCVAGKRAQYCNIRPFQKNLRSQIWYSCPLPNSLHVPCVSCDGATQSWTAASCRDWRGLPVNMSLFPSLPSSTSAFNSGAQFICFIRSVKMWEKRSSITNST